MGAHWLQHKADCSDKARLRERERARERERERERESERERERKMRGETGEGKEQMSTTHQLLHMPLYVSPCLGSSQAKVTHTHTHKHTHTHTHTHHTLPNP